MCLHLPIGASRQCKPPRPPEDEEPRALPSTRRTSSAFQPCILASTELNGSGCSYISCFYSSTRTSTRCPDGLGWSPRSVFATVLPCVASQDYCVSNSGPPCSSGVQSVCAYWFALFYSPGRMLCSSMGILLRCCAVTRALATRVSTLFTRSTTFLLLSPQLHHSNPDAIVTVWLLILSECVPDVSSLKFRLHHPCVP